jgi:glycosyltransferase involved in cell wall biosynthesis
MTATQPLKVLQFICSTGFYGAERWILALCKNTAKEDCVYSLVVTDEENSKDLELVKHFKRDCGEATALPMSNKFDLSVVGKLADHIKQNNIDIIHTHGYKSDILGMLAAKKAGIPVVVTPHGFENAEDFKLRAFIWLGCQSMRFADKVVPLSPALMKDVKGFGVKPSKLAYVQNGVDLSEVEYARDNLPANPKTKFRVGFIGQMISRKNIKDLLDVFASVHAKRENVELVFLGDGDERVMLEEYAGTLSCNNDIHFLGYRDDRLAYLKSFDVFAMTSTLEGIPRCLMEACAMGIPVVSYDIDGVDQLITHNETGLLAPLKDKEKLEALFLEVFDRPEDAQKLGQKAIEYVNKHYAASRMAQEYLVLFKQLLQTKHKDIV